MRDEATAELSHTDETTKGFDVIRYRNVNYCRNTVRIMVNLPIFDMSEIFYLYLEKKTF